MVAAGFCHLYMVSIAVLRLHVHAGVYGDVIDAHHGL